MAPGVSEVGVEVVWDPLWDPRPSLNGMPARKRAARTTSIGAAAAPG